MARSLLPVCGLVLLGCHSEPQSGTNVLVVVLDDIGIDQIGLHGVASDPAPTPTLDGLASEGVWFRNAWAHPTCSPTRAAMLTGRHPRRYGIGSWIAAPDDQVHLPDHEVALPRLLEAADDRWSTSLIGKWHLTGFRRPDREVVDDPGRMGFDWHAGSLANLNHALEPPEDEELGYYRWERDTNGRLDIVEEYATTVTASDGIDRMQAMREPWLLVVSFNAAHEPISRPPSELVSTAGLSPYQEVVEAVDAELGRLLDAVPDHTDLATTVLVVGDNGSPADRVDPELDAPGSKQDPYELGVRVPFVVTSPLLPERGVVSDALVHVTDVFATVAELAGLDPSALERPDGERLVHDSVSLVPYLRDPHAASVRQVMFSETFIPNGPPPYQSHRVGLRTADHKYVRSQDGAEELFAFRPDGLEGEELLAAGGLDPFALEELERLRAAADEIDAIPYGR